MRGGGTRVYSAVLNLGTIFFDKRQCGRQCAWCRHPILLVSDTPPPPIEAIKSITIEPFVNLAVMVHNFVNERSCREPRTNAIKSATKRFAMTLVICHIP